MALLTAALNDPAQIIGGGVVAKNPHSVPALVGAVAECKEQFP